MVFRTRQFGKAVTNPAIAAVLLLAPLLTESSAERPPMSHIRLEQSLRKAPPAPATESLCASAFDSAPHAMALMDSDGGILHANRAWCELLGFSKTELRLLTLSAITHPDDIATEAEQRQRLASSQIPRYELVQRCQRKDRVDIWVRLSVSATREAEGRPCNFVAQLENVPPYNFSGNGKGADAGLARFRDATLAAVHEIGNTLTPLMLNTEMLVEKSRDSGSEISESAEQIFKAARRIAFTLRRVWGIHEVQPVAYLGESRMLDLRLLPPRIELSSGDYPPADVA